MSYDQFFPGFKNASFDFTASNQKDDQNSAQAIWQDLNGNLWGAPIDRATGKLVLAQKQRLDKGLSSIKSFWDATKTKHRPEWFAAKPGVPILYIKGIHPGAERWVYQVCWTGSMWETEPIGIEGKLTAEQLQQKLTSLGDQRSGRVTRQRSKSAPATYWQDDYWNEGAPAAI